MQQYIDLICKRCEEEFQATSPKTLYCKPCLEIRTKERNEESRQNVKSVRQEQRRAKEEKKQKKIIISDEEQRKIDDAVRKKASIGVDLGRRLEGEEFARIAVLYQR